MTENGKKFEQFLKIVKELRSENGCPWDKEQTPISLQRYFLEETHETLEAISSGDHQHVMEELGDLLYLIILLAQVHAQENLFDIGDVLDTITAKMIRRHPHVFANEKINSAAELRKKWLEIKNNEKSKRHDDEKN